MMTTMRMWLVWFGLLVAWKGVAAFSPSRQSSATPTQTHQTALCMSVSDAARNLLYQDQQQAMLRRSLVEEELLNSRTQPSELEAPTFRTSGGFGKKSNNNPKNRLALQQAEQVYRDGVIRINHVLSNTLADELRDYVLEQQSLAQQATNNDPSLSASYYGVEQNRLYRCDLQLSLLKSPESSSHVVADTLKELLGETNGSLRALYEQLVTSQGEFYELAAVVTNPGSNRQMVHPDLPFQATAPLYVIFVALQDVEKDMGPTSFLLGTQTATEHAKFNDPTQKDTQLAQVECRLSCLKKGDAVLFDARILHCGNANDPIKGKTRALFNLSFRNPQVTGDLGYQGSIRPGYCQAMTLQDISDSLAAYVEGDKEPFAVYGSGLL